jgi:hypothetical protein
MAADTDYMYIFIREDISPPQQIVQASHASAIIGEKYHGDTSIVLCGAKNEEHLDVIASYLEQKGIDHAMFYEPDISACTAIATQPLSGKARSPLKKFELLQ